MGDVVFAIFSQILSIGINYRRCVVVDAGVFLLVYWHDQDHAQSFGCLTHQLSRLAIRNSLRHVVPASILFGAEVGAVKQLLQTNHLTFFPGGPLQKPHMLFDHGLLDLIQRSSPFMSDAGLDQSTSHNSCHCSVSLALKSGNDLPPVGFDNVFFFFAHKIDDKEIHSGSFQFLQFTDLVIDRTEYRKSVYHISVHPIKVV